MRGREPRDARLHSRRPAVPGLCLDWNLTKLLPGLTRLENWVGLCSSKHCLSSCTIPRSCTDRINQHTGLLFIPEKLH